MQKSIMPGIYAFTVIPLLFCSLASYSQTGYSEPLNSYVGDVNPDSLIYSVKKISGEIPVIVNGQPAVLSNRIWNTDENHLAAQYIYEQLQSLGYDVEFDQFSNEGYNVVATRTGSKYPDQQYILCAHYDNVAYDGQGTIAPGADDNGTGIVAMLKAAEIFNHFNPLYTIKFIAFDAEEEGMVGSTAYASNAAANGDSIIGVINLDMLGWDSNNDFVYLAVSNSQSQQLCDDFIQISELYVDGLNPLYSNIWYSDHSSFWNNGYTAMNIIEHHAGDFNAYYHTVLDVADSINKPYFLALTRASIAAFITKACDMYAYCTHEPLVSQLNTSPREAILVIESEHPIDGTNNPPKLHYSLNSNEFSTLIPQTYSNNEWIFEIPAANQGDKVEYFFEVNDSANVFTVTLPDGGRGIAEPPALLYKYYVADLTQDTYCSQNPPKYISHHEPVFDTISIGDQGLIVDLNIEVDVKHTYDADLKMTLISPAGTEILLCQNNGHYGNDFSITLFDDEAELSIVEGAAPFNGSYRPIDSLSVLEYHSLNGNWILKIEDQNAGDNGTLDYWCIDAKWSDDFTTGINEPGSLASKEILIYPNPSKEYIFIKLPDSFSGTSSLTIHDLFGRMVSEVVITGNKLQYIDTKTFKSGMYIVTVTHNNQLFQNKLIID